MILKWLTNFYFSQSETESGAGERERDRKKENAVFCDLSDEFGFSALVKGQRKFAARKGKKMKINNTATAKATTKSGENSHKQTLCIKKW